MILLYMLSADDDMPRYMLYVLASMMRKYAQPPHDTSCYRTTASHRAAKSAHRAYHHQCYHAGRSAGFMRMTLSQSSDGMID